MPARFRHPVMIALAAAALRLISFALDTKDDAPMLLAWLGAIAIGLSLGLLGSGGSIITVPVLVYLVGQPEKIAIAGSLGVVGSIALVGALQNAWRGNVAWRSVLWFGLPGMAGTYAGAWLSGYVSGAVQLTVFAVVMLAASFMMFRRGAYQPGGDAGRAAAKAVAEGLAVGTLTGFVGVGGGFLILPALVLLGGLGMRMAIGTSLAIIALNAFTGFFKYLHILSTQHLALDWQVLGTFVLLGAAGSVVGSHFASRVPQDTLRRLFAVFLVLMAAFILYESGPRAFGG
jgi:uncharacterized membrane protein YfcA